MTNRDMVGRWIDFAETDLISAEILLKSRSKYKGRYRNVIWLCHQTIEKMFKGILVVQDKSIIFTHDLLRLYKSTKIILDQRQIEYIEEVNVFYFPPRYPDLVYSKQLPEFNRQLASYHLKETLKLFKCLKQHIQKKL
ncbi:MAG: hypothetical protein UT11_C0071G0006 [Berkelbacteria bacterium GW2011_GWA2_38_9]|uniref:HEPN domain-containing protein n=1 Tax=Berkelbacteria bacterium GW2011_GWA2_38_9 TaxID=1618334 RepID=A0A0G0L5X8_9BACT|nr:MAG: hypothetical protein UT11_C0071G0006 [Berkelbacteria bacterium GW2011_GWA2_38_9]